MSVEAPAPPSWARFIGDLTRPHEESRTLRAVILAAVTTAVIALIANGVADGPRLWLAALVVIPAGSVVSYLRRRNTSPVVPLLLTLATAAAAVHFVVVNSHPASPGELRVPLAQLLVTMEAMRSFALRSRRELRFALASSVAMISVAGAISLSMTFAAFAAVWGSTAFLALVLAHRSELAELAGAQAPDEPLRVRLPIRAILTSLVAILGVASLAFLVVPAAKSSRLLAFTAKLPNPVPVPNPGGLSNPSLGGDDPGRPNTTEGGPAPESFGYFGFAKQLDTGVRGRPDDTLVMRVRTSAPDFWRGQTFDTWDGRVWSSADTRTVPVTGGSPLSLLQPLDEPPVAGEELIQTVSLEVPGPNLIFAANQPVQVYIPQSTLFETTDGSVRTGVELEQGAVYTVVSRRPQATEARLRAVGSTESTTPPALVRRYTQLSPQTPDRVRELARKLTAGEITTYDKIRAIEAWMGRNTRYSLDIPPLPAGEDAVERFLFEDKIGFCEQIASSLVVMLRSQGIPARLAVGYTPGERNPFTGLYEVRAKDAHAWAEVYFPSFGWVSFDPTAEVPFAGDPPPDAARVGLRSYLARHLPDLSLPVLTGLVMAFVVAGIALYWRPIAAAWARRRRRRRRSWAQVQMDRLDAIGADLGRERTVNETVREYADGLQRTVLRDPRVGEVADALTAEAFADEPLDDERRAWVEETLSALVKR